MLMMIAPLLNVAVERMVELRIWWIWLLFALAMTLNWLPLHGMTGVAGNGVGSHSLAMMVFVYTTARLLAVSKVEISRKHLLGGVGIFLIGIAFSGLFVEAIHHFPFSAESFRQFSTYDAPYVWIMALTVLVFFVKFVKVPIAIGHIFSFLAPSIFGVYLFHEVTGFGHDLILGSQRRMASMGDIHPLFGILTATVFVFCLGLIVDSLRRLLLLPVKHRLFLLLERLDRGWTNLVTREGYCLI